MATFDLTRDRNEILEDTKLSDEVLTIIGDTEFIVDSQSARACVVLTLTSTELVVASEFQTQVKVVNGGIWSPFETEFDLVLTDGLTNVYMGTPDLAGMYAVRFCAAQKKAIGIPDLTLVVERHFEVNTQRVAPA